jgi:hypothetical protein
MASSSSSVIVNFNGAFYKLSVEGVLEEIPAVEQDDRSISSNQVAGLMQNPVSSVSETAAAKASGEHSGLVGVDVHGTRTFLRPRL